MVTDFLKDNIGIFEEGRVEMRLWLDDIRPAPEGFVWVKSVNAAKKVIELSETKQIFTELIDVDHDLGDYANDGGDAIKLLDRLAERGIFYPIKIHTANPVGRVNMERLIARY